MISKPKAMTANEAAHWMIDHPLESVLCHKGCSRFEFRYVAGHFMRMINREAWFHEGFCASAEGPSYYVQKDYDDWWNDGSVPTRKTLEEIAKEELRQDNLVPYIGDSDRSYFRAVERYIEERLREAGK